MRIFISILCTLVVLSSDLAIAADPTYPGFQCMPSPSGGTDPDISYSVSSLWNTHPTYPRPVYCPVLRQNVMNTNGVDSAFVRVYDASPDYGFSCTLYAYSTTGAVLESESAITGTAFTGATTLYFEGLSSSSVGGHFGIYCSVPPGYSRIYSYRVKEFEQ
ncbi:MAG: hypothetical protein H6722_07720 [Sandaracinus sp.]|nr:hypothetical protein [Sandaracinus sp.]MCB9612322.1 hypothetical protein [Sandaracinus sp.]